jgi:hypothetical protein
MEYQPKLFHVFISIIIGTIFFVASVSWPFIGIWLQIAGLLSWSCIVLIYARLIIDTRKQMFYVQKEWLSELRQMDPEQWRALGLINIPFINITWEGETMLIWEGTVSMKYFEHFMHTSNDSQTSPKGEWNTKKYPERVWTLIYNRLVQLGFVIPDSAAGNHSYLWRPGMRAEAWARYLTPHITEMVDIPSPSAKTPQFGSRNAPQA